MAVACVLISHLGNMRIITAIYLTCRPALREEWMTGLETESDVDESALQESNLRALIKAYHTRRYLPTIPPMQRRLESTNIVASHMYDLAASATDSSFLISSPLDDNEEIELDSAFMDNYEQWLEDEVYSIPSSPDISATGSFTNDYLVSPALSDSPIHQFYQDEERYAAARQINELYRSALDLEFNFDSTTKDNGWDAPVQFIRSYDPHPDDIHFDDDLEDTVNDPLSDIDWTALKEEELQARLLRIERQTIQRRLRTDDENDHKVLNAFEDLAIDNDEWNAP
ncbi:hypothetical protein NQZ79_g7034 [Umbelopsis isabellina]|nr:hypothetical protein NQZ79_g7034 [Umbelopsis isabellina]